MDSPVIKTSVETQTLQYQEKTKNFNLAESKLKLCSEIVLLSNLLNQKEEILEKIKKNNEIVLQQSNNPELNHELYNLYTTYMQKNNSIRSNYSSIIKNFNEKTRYKWDNPSINKYSRLNYEKYSTHGYGPYVNEMVKDIQKYNRFIKNDVITHYIPGNNSAWNFFQKFDLFKYQFKEAGLHESYTNPNTRVTKTIKHTLKEYLIANEDEFNFIKKFVDTKKDLFLKQMETNETKYNLCLEELSQHRENIRSLQDKKKLLESDKQEKQYCKDEIKAAEIHVDIVKINVDIKNIEEIIKKISYADIPNNSDRWECQGVKSQELFTELTNMIIKINEHIIKLYDIIDSFPKFIEELKEFKKLQYNEAHELFTKFEKITYIKIEIVDNWYDANSSYNEFLSIEDHKVLFEYPSIKITEGLISRYIHGNPYKSIFIIFEDLKDYFDEKVIIQLKNDLNYMTYEQNIIDYYKYKNFEKIIAPKLQAKIKTNTNNIIKSENNIKIFEKEVLLNQELYNEITAKIEYENAKKELESFKQSI